MNTNLKIRSQQGFTLIELLVIISILGILSTLGIATFRSYKANASNAASKSSVRDAITDIEGALNNVDQTYSFVSFTQTTPGALTDPAARAALSTFVIPKNQTFQLTFDTSCDSAACTNVFLRACHQLGNADTQYMRMGDGVSLLLEVAGPCS